MSLKIENFVIKVRVSGDVRGGYVQRKRDKIVFAYKEIGPVIMSNAQRESAKQEVSLLVKLESPYLVQYLGDLLDPYSGAMFVVYQCYLGGDLGGYIGTKRQQNTPIDEVFIWKVFCQLCAGLIDCWEQLTSNNTNITYLDINPCRIHLTKNNDVKLEVVGATQTLSFTHYYNPDTAKSEGRTAKSTVWSLGCLLQEMCSLVRPKRDAPLVIPINYSQLLYDTITKMLSVDCMNRPSIDALVSAPELAFQFQQFTSSNSVQFFNY